MRNKSALKNENDSMQQIDANDGINWQHLSLKLSENQIKIL